jgi:hypothetical protein
MMVNYEATTCVAASLSYYKGYWKTVDLTWEVSHLRSQGEGKEKKIN